MVTYHPRMRKQCKTTGHQTWPQSGGRPPRIFWQVNAAGLAPLARYIRTFSIGDYLHKSGWRNLMCVGIPPLIMDAWDVM